MNFVENFPVLNKKNTAAITDENISLALSISGIKAKEIDKRVQVIARALNITEVSHGEFR